MEAKKKVFFLSRDLESRRHLVELLEDEFDVISFHYWQDMQGRIIPGKVPDLFIFDYSIDGYTKTLGEVVRAIKRIDSSSIIFGLYSVLDITEGKQALSDGCTDIVNCLNVEYIVKKSSMLCKSKACLTKRVRSVTNAMRAM